MDYEYANARIRGMKSRLLPLSTLETLINRPDLVSLVTELEKTAYREEMEKAGLQHEGITQIEVALRKDLANRFRKIQKLFQSEENDIHLKLILHRWDVQNIKTILRGKHTHILPDEILSCLIPAGELDEAALVELSRQPDIKAVIDLLATWRIEYYIPLIRHYKEFTEKRDMAVLEYALDKFYYEHALAMVKKGESDDDRIIREFLITEIDVTNLKTILKVIWEKMEPAEAEQFLIKGSIRFGKERLSALIHTGTIEGAIRQLTDTPYQFLSNVPEKYVATGKISEFEKELDRHLVKRGIRYFLGDPLSIAMGLGYIWAKVNEVTNIRIIARGKAGEVSEKELREALIHV
jgi:V/A-type H+-transporting ATPase subunit C